MCRETKGSTDASSDLAFPNWIVWSSFPWKVNVFCMGKMQICFSYEHGGSNLLLLSEALIQAREMGIFIHIQFYIPTFSSFLGSCMNPIRLSRHLSIWPGLIFSLVLPKVIISGSTVRRRRLARASALSLLFTLRKSKKQFYNETSGVFPLLQWVLWNTALPIFVLEGQSHLHFSLTSAFLSLARQVTFQAKSNFHYVL